jgi:CHAT domain-containing protein
MVRLWIDKPHPGGLNADSSITSTLRYLRLALLGAVLSGDRQPRLLIAPEGILHQFPFAILPESATGEYVPLMNAHELVVLPSASVGGMIRSRPARPRRGRIAVFADPVPAPDVSAERRAPAPNSDGSARELFQLAPLTFSREEGESIGDIWPDIERYFGVRATPENAIGALTKGFSIVHFAVHGIAHPEPPYLAGLILSQLDSLGQPQNGYLGAERIAAARTSVGLIVASACDTGSGGDLSGEGVMSLTRAFLYAGAPSVIASLWRVDDGVAVRFMRTFYDFLLTRGVPPAAALRETQKAMWNRAGWSDPRLWANFQAYGDWR